MATSDVKVNVKADGAGFNRTMSSLEGRVRSFGSNIKTQLAAAFGVGALAAFARSVVQYAGNIKDAAEQLDVTPETAQGLQVIAKNAGGDLNVLEGILAKVEAAKNDALSGNTGKQNVFEELGLSIGDLQAKNPVGLLEDLARAYKASNGNPAFATALADLIGTKSVPKFRGMSEDLANLQDKLKQLRDSGLIIKDKDIENLDAYGKSWERLATKVKAKSATLFFQTPEKVKQWFDEVMQTVHNLHWQTVEENAAEMAKPIDKGAVMDKYIASLEAKLKAIEVPEELRQLGIAPVDVFASGKGVDAWIKEYIAAVNEKAPNGFNAKPVAVPSDSLLSIGNFLGSRTSSMTSIANRTNELLLDIRKVLYDRLLPGKQMPAAPSNLGSGFMP